jgi:putative molybdopterin biosynthesis protein
MGGLLAIRRGEAHIAGTHLMDEESGEYNVSFIKRYIPNREVALVHLAARTQGLMVKRGNQLNISSLADLTRADVRFVNRQRGSGTRVLLDYELRRSGIDSADVKGYNREEYTHLAVAAAVSGDKADTGLGILPAARAMGLGFIPLFSEEYDIVIPAEFYESDQLAPMLELIRSPEFQREVEALGGYDTSNMGSHKVTLGGSRT